jgi:hypothetical protein
MVGHAYRKSLLPQTLAPNNPNFERRQGDGTLRRQVAHEVHHAGVWQPSVTSRRWSAKVL